VIDHQFGTTDVLIVLPVSAINIRYIDHFGGAKRSKRRGGPSEASPPIGR
jgi:putative hemolysin